MAVDTVRRNADTMPAAEFTNFLRACVLLKNRRFRARPSASTTSSSRFTAASWACGRQARRDSRISVIRTSAFCRGTANTCDASSSRCRRRCPGSRFRTGRGRIQPEPSDLFSNSPDSSHFLFELSTAEPIGRSVRRSRPEQPADLVAGRLSLACPAGVAGRRVTDPAARQSR